MAAETTTVVRIADLATAGTTHATTLAQIGAARWQRFGRAVLLHNDDPSPGEQRRIVLANSGPRSALTSFSALSDWGLTSWDREQVQVLAANGARVWIPPSFSVRVHRVRDWEAQRIHPLRRLHRVPDAAALAAASMPNPRHGCGLLAATVQQRLTRPSDLIAALQARPVLKNRGLYLAAAYDIAMGSHALSEIDFVRLCRRAGLPVPVQQAIRRDKWGNRRYLDATWRLRSGRSLVVEVDGALHRVASRWWADELRQNEIVIAGDPVLRFPSVIVRCERALVVDQLRRGLLL